ncbi:MAG: right-handed parallel beta-helix repeat-containing protein [Anaerolineaceae bacterium]|nr:right-handed parallel beta-helix repeat-containing protein [Anaerolineaceae bacterium]
MAIYGDGPDQTIIDANQIDRVLHINPTNACTGLENCAEDALLLSGLTIKGGAASYGGGIYHENGPLTINWTKLTDNYADGSHVCTGSAGAAYLGNLSAVLELRHSEVTNNTTLSTSLNTNYGVLAGRVSFIYDTRIDQNDADWAIIIPDYENIPGCIGDDPDFRVFIRYLRASITNTTGGAFTANIQPDRPDLEPMFEDVTISGNGAGIRFTNNTGNYVLLEGLAPGSSSFVDVTVANNTSVGLDLIGDLQARVTNIVIADNGTNCTDYVHGTGVISDLSCVDPNASELTAADPQLTPLIASEYHLYHSTQPGSPAENVGDYGPPIFVPEPLVAIDVISSKYYTNYGLANMDGAVEGLGDQLIVEFNHQPYNPPGDTDPNDVTNPANYMLVTAGDNETIESTACDAIGGDDVLVPIEELQFFPYGSPDRYLQAESFIGDVGPNTIINFDESALGDSPNRLALRSYRFFVCNNLRTVDGGNFDGRSDFGTGTENSDAIFDFQAGGTEYLSLTRMAVEDSIGSKESILATDYQGNEPPYLSYVPPDFEPLVQDDIKTIEFWSNLYLDALQILDTDVYFQFVAAGPNGLIDTQTCGSVSGDDISLPLTNPRVGSGYYLNIYTVREEAPFYLARIDLPSIDPGEKYAFIACDTIQEVEGTRLDGDYDGLPSGNLVKSFYTLPTSRQLMPTVNSVTGTQIELALPDIALPEGVTFDFQRSNLDESIIIAADVPADTPFVVDENFICESDYRYRVRFRRPGPGYGTLPDDYISYWSYYLDVTSGSCAGPWVERVWAENQQIDLEPYDARITEILIDFSYGLSDTGGDAANYRLYEAGDNGIIDSVSCDALSGDDQSIPLAVHDFTVGDDIVFLHTSDGNPLPVGEYAIVACETLAGEDDGPLDGDRDGIAGGEVWRNFSVLEPIKVAAVNTVHGVVATPLNDGDVRDFPFESIEINYSKDIRWPYFGSYYLLMPGSNGIFDTDHCIPYYDNDSDDIYVDFYRNIVSITTISMDLREVLPQTSVRIIICGVQDTNQMYLDADDDDIGGDIFVLDFEVRRAPHVVNIISDVGPLDALTSLDMQTISITFNEPMANPVGDTEVYDITNPTNYRLIGHGPDHVLQSDLCGPLAGDDLIIPIGSVAYDDVNFVADVEIVGGPNFSFATYTFVICQTIQDAQGTPLDGDNDFFPGEPYSTSFVLDIAQLDSDIYVNTTEVDIIGNCGVLHCSLREAVIAANKFKDVVVTIHLQPDALYEFTTSYIVDGQDMKRALPQMTSNVIIKGNGATLQRSYAPDTPDFQFIYHLGYTATNNYTSLTIENLTFKNGLMSGGAISGSQVNIYDCRFEDNTSTRGAISTFIGLVIDNSYFLHNRTYNPSDGNISGFAPMGAALYSMGQTRITNSIFEENESIAVGGAIGVYGDDQVIIENNLFIRNEAKYHGTAIYLVRSYNNQIINNTFVDNRMTNTSPIPNQGGTITFYRSGNSEVVHNTIADQAPLSVALIDTGFITIHGNIMVGDGPLCYDDRSDDDTTSSSSTGYNVAPSAACLSQNLDNGDVLADPQLGQLQYAGGPTSILPLGLTSPALDLIPESECAVLQDQRGIARPIDGDGDGIAACDAGAFETLTLGTAFSSDLSLSFFEPTSLPPDGGLFTVRAILHNDGPIAAENVSVIFGGEHASIARDAEFLNTETGRWQPGNILPGTDAIIDLVYRADLDMKGSSLTVFGELERNVTVDLDSTPDNGNISEDDYASLTLSVGCSIVPSLIEPGDVDGMVSAMYAANDEICNPGPDAFSLAPDSTYLVHNYSYSESGFSSTQYTAFPPVDSEISIDGQGAIIDFDRNRVHASPLRFFLTFPGSRLTLSNMTLQHANGNYTHGSVIKSQGDLVLRHMTFNNNESYYSSHIYHTIGSLLIQDSYFEHNGGTLIVNKDAIIARIERSTFSNNYLDDYVVLNQNTELDVINTTFVNNSGQAVSSFSSGTVRIEQSTFYNNGLALDNQYPKIVLNSIFGPNDWICKGTTDSAITSEGYNVLLQDAVNNLPQDILECGFNQPTDMIVTDVGLLPLASYNGSLPVMRPASDSPAVDLIPPESCYAGVDQRFIARPFNGACDAGAVELALDESFGIPDALQLIDVTDSTIALELPVVPSSELSIQLERRNGSSNSTWQPIVTYTSGTTTHVDSGLICGQAYQYRVLFISDAGTFFSQPSTALEVVTSPCERPITHTFGLYKEGQWLFYTLDGDQRYDARFNWGPQEPGGQAVIGDWNGDGIDGIGLYKDGRWLLRSVDLSGTVTDTEFTFGDTLNGAIALAGDWDGNGVDTVGLFQTGVAYLRNSNSTGVADVVLSVGSTTSVPVAGDWNGNGVDTVGLYESTIFSLIAQNSQPPTMQTTFSFGPLNWQPLAGDWNDDGIDTVGIYNQGLWRMRNSNAGGSVDVGFNYGNLEGGWQPIGNFDSSPAILNLLFAATMPTPRVPVIPGPSLPIIPTEVAPENLPPAPDEASIEATSIYSATSTPSVE